MRSPLVPDDLLRIRVPRLVARSLVIAGVGLTGPSLEAQEKITFQDHIRPIFESSCHNCHNPDKKKGGLDLTSFTGAMTGGSSGEIVASGASADSRLFKSVARLEEPFMPPQGSPLGAKEIELIKKWIDGGVLDTPNGVAKKAKKPAFDMQVASAVIGKFEGPPPMPEHLLLEPVVISKRPQATAALASNPRSPLVAISGQHQVLLYNTDSLELAGILPFPEGFVEALNFSRNGQLLLAGGGRGGKSGRIVAWEVKTGRRVIELGEEREIVLGADITADQALVALGGPSRLIKLYQTASGELSKEIKKHTDWVTAVQFSPDGVLLATGDRAGNLYVWEAKSGNDFFTLSGHSAAISALSWRADANILASASEDGTIRLWEMNEGKEVRKWNAHGGGVQSMAFSHDGRLVSCGRDNQVRIWKQDGAQQAAQNQFADLPLAACFTHNAEKFVVGDWTGKVTVWNAKDATAAGEMSAAPPSIEQRLASIKPELHKTEQAVTAAKGTLGSLANNLSAAQQQVDQGKQMLSAFQSKTASLEQNLAQARSAADALLQRLGAPLPAPAAASTAMAMDVAKALAEDLQNVTTNAKASLVPSGAKVRELKDQFATLPTQLVSTIQLVKGKEAELPVLRQKSDEAGKALEVAAAALETHKRALLKWDAAKVNAAIFGKREELSALASKLEDVTANLSALEKTNAESAAKVAQLAADEKARAEQETTETSRIIETLKKEKGEIETRIAECKKAIDAETRKYLSMLPKQDGAKVAPATMP
ncbi:MAG: c-type cytochrome domain-containing protein [Verrucomicrobiales bacterium]